MEVPHQQSDQFIRLFTVNESAIRRYAMSLLADWNAVDDIVQEASVAMYNKFDQYDANLPFVNWACRFAYFEVLKYRKNERRRRCFSEATIEALAIEPSPHDLPDDVRRTALADCLGRLGQNEQELIQLRYATSRTLAEVAQELDTPATKLYKQLARIRRRLMGCIEQATNRVEHGAT